LKNWSREKPGASCFFECNRNQSQLLLYHLHSNPNQQTLNPPRQISHSHFHSGTNKTLTRWRTEPPRFGARRTRSWPPTCGTSGRKWRSNPKAFLTTSTWPFPRPTLISVTPKPPFEPSKISLKSSMCLFLSHLCYHRNATWVKIVNLWLYAYYKNYNIWIGCHVRSF